MKKGSKKPCYECGGPHMEMGGNPQGMYWNGERYVKAKGTGTYRDQTYFQGGGPTYYPPKQKPGYWNQFSYIQDGGNITELEMGGYIPASINTQPQILKQTDGVYHMATGGYVPASINAKPEILKRTDGVYHMQNGGAVYNGVYTAKPGAPIRKMGGPATLPNRTSDYWTAYPYAMDGGNITELQYGGMVGDIDDPTPEYKGGGHWIQKAINPAHKGYCTPMTKSTCTPHRKALAKTFKKHHGFHKEYGGPANPFHPLAEYALGGGVWGAADTNDDSTMNSVYAPVADANAQAIQESPMGAQDKPMVSPDSPMGPGANPNYQIQEEPQPTTQQQPKGPNGWQKAAMYGQGFNNLLGAGLATAANFANRKSERSNAAYNRSLGMSQNMPTYQNPGSKGDYNQQGQFRPNMMTPSNAGMYLPGHAQYGGNAQQYEHGGEYHLDAKEIARLRKLGYQIEEL